MNIFDFILKHEGLRLKPYKDTGGLLHIGIGRNLEQDGISKDEAILLCTNDINTATHDLNNAFPWFQALSENRKTALIDMCFNLGIVRLLEFKNFIGLMESGDYEKASAEMLNSLWAKQVPYRAQELSELVLNG